ncbi:MAG: PilZ domain-containing protein, partial [Anaeromyxobacteraceae bacterium]
MDLIDHKGSPGDALGGGGSPAAPPFTMSASPALAHVAAPAPQVRGYEELDGAHGRGVFFRPHRFTAADLAPLTSVVSVVLEAETLDVPLHDVSQNGVAFEWPAGEPLREGELVRLILRFDGHQLWHGDARVSSVREQDGVVGASFESALLETEQLLHLRDISSWRVDGSLRANESCWGTPAHDRLKALAADFRLFLEDSSDRLGELEKRLPWHVMQDPASPARSALVRRLRSEFGAGVQRFMFELDTARRTVDPDASAELQRRSHRQVHGFLMQAPWMHRALHKPFGYPGDYELMNYFYEKDFEGP